MTKEYRFKEKGKNIYEKGGRMELLKDDELTKEEAAFMKGYDRTSGLHEEDTKEKKLEKRDEQMDEEIQEEFE